MDLYYTPNKMPLYMMAKPVGSMCNLNCSYCYYLEKSKMYANNKNQMSDLLLERYVKSYIEMQPSSEVLFTWHGGEPLLRGLDFFKKALDFQKYYSIKKHIRVDNSLQTNGLLLNDEWCDFFAKHNFLIGLSLDGTEHCHNKYRKNYNDEGSYSKVLNAIRLLQKHGVEFNILAVVNNYNVNYPIEIYEHFKELGCRFIQFTPIVERISLNKSNEKMNLLSVSEENDFLFADWNVDSLAYGIFLSKIFEKWVKNDVADYYIINFDSTLANWIGQAPGICTHAKYCGHAMAMEHNGDVFACDHFVFPEYKRGNILINTLSHMLYSEEQQEFGKNKYNKLSSKCLKCKYLFACNGGCPKDRIIETEETEEKLNYFCKGYKYYFEYVEPYMEFMCNELRNNRPPANVMKWERRKF